MKIIVDAMGGDNAPLEIVRGALDANRNHGVEIILVGRTAEVLKAVEACGQKSLPAGVEIKDAKEVVEIADDPAMAFKQKPDSSLTVGLNLLKDGAGDAFVSAGSTGALLSGATLVVKRIRGIRRAAMGPQIPTAGGRAVLCDCGANAECTPEYLLQFAYLGSYYAQRVMGIEKPRVGLLNIGAEEEKGDTRRLHRQCDAENHGGRRQVPAQVPEGDVPLQHQDQAGRRSGERGSGADEKAAGSQRGGRHTLPGDPKAGDQGPWRFQRQGHRKCGAAGQGVCGKRFHRGHSGQHRTHAGPARHGKKLISY